MARYRITIEYDGTPFIGWQVQAAGRSIQGRLAEAIEKFCGERVDVRGAGRTDSGVHALGQVAHFDLAQPRETGTIRDAVNFHLKPDPICVLACEEVEPDFDARFSARRRHYLYRILARRAPPAIDRHHVWWIPVPLDVEAMARAAEVLTGRHDFTTFRASGCQAKSPVKTLDVFQLTRDGDEIRAELMARSFLHHQVRSMMGSLKLVGEGKWSKADLAEALAAADRTRCGPVAPASGLYLTRVDYV